MTMRTNFYKLSMEELEDRLYKLRLAQFTKDPKQLKLIETALNLAYQISVDRKKILADPLKYQSLKKELEEKWGNVPEKYEDTSAESNTASGMA